MDDHATDVGRVVRGRELESTAKLSTENIKQLIQFKINSG
jgi:hypothetical protein